VTEWEVISAFQHEGEKKFSTELQAKAIWSHRRFRNGLQPSKDEDPNGHYCDVRENPVNKQYLYDLKNWMKSAFSAQNTELYGNESSLLTIADLNSESQSLGSVKVHYLDNFRDFVESKLKQSLDEIISSKQLWSEDACGLGLDGRSVSEMLHHCQWACEKVEKFYGRE
jgi:hypothetical protein